MMKTLMDGRPVAKMALVDFSSRIYSIRRGTQRVRRVFISVLHIIYPGSNFVTRRIRRIPSSGLNSLKMMTRVRSDDWPGNNPYLVGERSGRRRRRCRRGVRYIFLVPCLSQMFFSVEVQLSRRVQSCFVTACQTASNHQSNRN